MPISNELDKLAADGQQETAVAEQSEVPQETSEQTPQDSISEAAAFEQQTAAAERLQAEIEARDAEFLAALDRVLEKQNNRAATPQRNAAQQLQRIPVRFVKKGVGVISLSLILIFMGVVMVGCLFSPSPDYLLPLKLSPVAAVLIGLELLLGYLSSGKHFRIHIPSICISAVLVVGCCVMAVALNKSYSATKTEYNNRTVAAEIYDSSYKELRYVADISTLKVEVDLNPDGLGNEKGMEALSTDDIVTITVELGGSYSNPTDFASECKSIIDGYKILGIPVTSFSFVNEGRLHSFALDIDGKFIQDYSESRLAELVKYVYIEDYDYLYDLEDFVAETEETAETTEQLE